MEGSLSPGMMMRQEDESPELSGATMMRKSGSAATGKGRRERRWVEMDFMA